MATTGIIGISAPELARYTAFYAHLSGMAKPDGAQIVYSTGAAISENRNLITELMLKEGAEWVLYLDDDHILQPDTLTRLLETGKDIISAHYIQREQPFNPVLLETELPNGSFTRKQLSPAENGVIKVAAAGAGCLLVRRAVIEALEPPYWTLGQLHPAHWGDDLHFCSRARQAGFEVFCDLDNRIGHMMTGVVWPRHDPEQGWQAYFAKDLSKGILSKWPMPLPGDF